MTDGKFQDLVINNVDVIAVDAKQRSLVITTPDGKILFRKRALSQLLSLLGLSIYDYKKNPDSAIVLEAFQKQERPIVVGVVESTLEGIDWYAFRSVTGEYTPIPHRLLFDFVDGVLKQHNIPYIEKKFYRWYRRSGMLWVLDQQPLDYRRENDYFIAGLLVTNANTAKDAIHVMGAIQIAQCINTISAIDYHTAVHKGEVDKILARVKDAVLNVVDALRQRYPRIKRIIEELQEEEIPESVIRVWVEKWLEKVPKKYHRWFKKMTYLNRKEFGNTKLALWQTATYFATRMQKYNLPLARAFQKEALEVLEVR